ncbi:alkaline phosphatase family protein [Flavisolibacter sp. BT320]|nr:alkaline phosphatase family protein [Flavisolibacter longurius]
MKKSVTAFLLLIVFYAQAQTPVKPTKPKLVVGIMVDQMRWDYLYRFQERFGEGGFKRMLGEGFSCENTFMPFTPTYTAAGHASVYTGSVPSLNGILGNNWFNRYTNQYIYCTDDSTVRSVGSTSGAGEMSPRNMIANTITDELRLSTNFRSKTIGIALKDRGAILPAGHTANAAYWFDDASGGWISSTYYMQNLPKWMTQLNAKKLPEAYLAKSWKTLYPIETYVQSTADAKPYEGGIPGEDNTFEHRLDTIKSARYAAFRVSPYGNSFTVDAAKAAVEGEALGARGVTDFLAVSFSSPDYIGHTFGPNSIEVEDMYLRLDKDLADFMTYLDGRIGEGQYLLFLTADHAVAHVPGFAWENKLPAGLANATALQRTLNEVLQKTYGNGSYIQTIINYQVFLNRDILLEKKLDKAAVKSLVIETLLAQPSIEKAVDLENIPAAGLPRQVEMMVVNGYHQKYSGDIQFVYRPQWFEGGSRGTTHGSWNPYDSHIPLLWYGWGIKQGQSNREVYMTDIAPTVAALLQIQMPNASIGKVIEEVRK